MSIRWDAVLARAVAHELDEVLSDARLRAVRLDGRTRDVLLLFRERTLVWRLHPNRGYPLWRDPIEPEPTDLRLRTRVRRVTAPADERMLVFELVGERSGEGGYEVVVELMGNQLNAVVTEGVSRTARHVLRTREGRRITRVGRPYAPPPPGDRMNVSALPDAEAWDRLLDPILPPARASELIRSVAWTSPLNAGALLESGYDLWRRVADDDLAPSPVIMETERGLQPYPFVIRSGDARPVDSLMDAFAEIGAADASEGDAPPALAVSPQLLERLEHEVAQAERRVVRLQAELDGREDPDALRAAGDLILARYTDIPGGASTVRLTGFEGVEVDIELDPALAPHDNASVYYDRAARSERVEERLPGLIDEAEGECTRLASMLDRARSGELAAAQVSEALPERAAPASRLDAPAALPYRRYRSSGGLEIRVGRGARHNDDLTFRHSAPNDVWMHARHTAGAHVILRWPGPGNPPARDLAEAGTLAALHSKARTSGSVPVDWTLRKYVRKPRGAKAGSVVPERVQTIFVHPDPALAVRLGETD